MSVYGPLLVCKAYRCFGREVRLLTYASDSPAQGRPLLPEGLDDYVDPENGPGD
jgi:hypothetical protein